MKPIIRSLVALLVLAAVLPSCSHKAPDAAKYIPKTASFVLILESKSVQDKLQKGGITIDTLLKKIFDNGSDTSDKKSQERINDFRANAGIDWSSNIYFFTSQKPGKQKDATTNVLSVMTGINDAAKLEAFLKKQDELKHKEIKKESDYSYFLTGNSTMIAWNNKQLIATIFHETVKPVFDTVTNQFRMPADTSRNSDLIQEVNAYFTQKTDASMASVESFANMFKEKADGYAFTSSNGTLGSLSMMPLQLPKLEELVKDNYSASTLSFEDGKIVAHSTTYTNPMVSSILKQYAGPIVNMSMIEHYPSEHINGVMLASFNPDIFSGVLKQLEVEGLVNGFLQKAGFTSQDLYKAMKGDIAVVVSDLGTAQGDPAMKQDEKSMIRTKQLGKMILNIAVGDQASFNKLMDKAVELGYLVKQGSVYKGGSLLSMMGLYLVADNKNMILASDSLTYSRYVSNTGKAVISSDVTSKLKGKSTAFYFDIANTIKGFMPSPGTGSFDHSMQTASETFKDVIGTSDNFDGKSVKAVMEVRMQNEKQNSLVTLTSLLTDIAVDMHTQAKKEKQMDGIFPGGVPAIIRTN